MDKETLSNYGWIVICVLVLAVMIALATPFGSYISTAVKSTTQGLFDTNKNALNSTGLINVGDQSFSDGTGTGDSGNGTDTGDSDGKDADSDTKNTMFYYDSGDYLYTKKVISGNELGAPTIDEGKEFVKKYYAQMLFGVSFDDLLAMGFKEDDIMADLGLTADTFVPAVLGDGWKVNTKSKDKTSYDQILESINGEPVTDMTCTFEDCKNLKTAPVIPSSVTDMTSAFNNCTSLTTAPAIPSKVTNMKNTFYNCIALTTAPVIPSNVTNMYGTFSDCYALKGTIEINANPTEYTMCLTGTSITEVTGSTTLKENFLSTRCK